MENKELKEAAERFYTTEDTKRDCNFIEGAKSDAARDYWFEKFQKEIIYEY